MGAPRYPGWRRSGCSLRYSVHDRAARCSSSGRNPQMARARGSRGLEGVSMKVLEGTVAQAFANEFKDRLVPCGVLGMTSLPVELESGYWKRATDPAKSG